MNNSLSARIEGDEPDELITLTFGHPVNILLSTAIATLVQILQGKQVSLMEDFNAEEQGALLHVAQVFCEALMEAQGK